MRIPFLGTQGFGDGAHAGIAGRLARMFVHAVEEICHRQIKKPGYRVESAGADTVHAFFIFLNLLKAYTDGFSESLLRYALRETCGPHPATDMNVHGVGTSSEHRVDSLILRRYKPGNPEALIEPKDYFDQAAGKKPYRLLEARSGMLAGIFFPGAEGSILVALFHHQQDSFCRVSVLQDNSAFRTFTRDKRAE